MRHQLLLATLLSTLALAQQPFTVKDYAPLRSARGIAVSTNGTILYHVTFGELKGRTQSEYWTISSTGINPAKLDLSEDFSPISFTTSSTSLYGTFQINKQPQLAIFPITNHKAATVPAAVILLPNGIKSALASPDGRHFAIIADPSPADPLNDTRHVIATDQSSLYVVNADGTGGTWWCPALTNISDFAWNPDSSSIALQSQLPHIGYHRAGTAIDVCTATATRHITDVPNSASGIAWANNGTILAFLSTKSEVLTPEHVFTVPASGGTAEDRTPELQGTAMAISADPQGHVYVLTAHGVQNTLEEFGDNSLKPIYHWDSGIISGLPVHSEYSTAAPIALNVADPTHTTNVAIPESGNLRKITHEGDEQLAKISLGPVRTIHWTSKEGIALEGIATFPAGYVEGTKYPFLVLPHGGPESNDSLDLDFFARAIAGLGYIVIQPEYRGSTGYGAPFLAAIYQHFGDRAFRDVDSATDFAIAQGWADPNRLAIFGWSAGGFMTSWTVTQTTRYKAAIEGAGITDWEPFLWTSDVAQFDFDARWTDESPEHFRKFSAVAFANKVTTPLLILHGESDQRVPTFQGIEFFQILAARNKTVRLVTYPGSPHFPTLWEQRINVFDEIAAWLEKYNK